MLEKPIYIYINKLINLLIKSNCLTRPKPAILKNWILNLENPNDLDLVNELRQIDIWLGEDPERAKRWKKGWMERVQSWRIRTQRFDDHKPPKIKSSVFAAISTAPKDEKPFIHECLIHCVQPCWMRELTIAAAENPGSDFQNWDYRKAHTERIRRLDGEI